MKNLSNISDYLVKFRYLIGALIILICVLMNINGSSLGMWHQYYHDENVPYKALLGEPRSIRSDEWSITTPQILSQEHNNPPYSTTNNLIRGNEIDITLYPGLPALDFTLIFRPFLICFVFFGSEVGLSFYWASRSVFLWLSAFEVCRVFTKKSNALPALFATSILFAPGIQWWFTAAGLIEMIVGGNYFIVALDSYLLAIKSNKRVFPWLTLMFFGGGIYLLTLYPAWMATLGYVYLTLTVFVLVDKKALDTIKIKHFIQLAITGILLFVSFGLMVLRAKDTLTLISSSEYPGERVTVGGGYFNYMFYYIGNFLFKVPDSAAFDKTIIFNECEASGFYGLFPFSLFLSILILILLYKQKRKVDSILLIGSLSSFLFILFSAKAFPVFLAKITLLSFSTNTRVILVLHLLNLILLTRCVFVIAEKEVVLSTKIKIFSLLVAAVTAAFLLKMIRYSMADYMRIRYLIAIPLIVLIPACIMLLSKRFATLSMAFIAIVSLYAGILVNPINVGTANVYDTALAKEIIKIVETNPDDLWVTEYGYPFGEYPLLMGAKTFNCTQPYPINEDFKLLDSQEKYTKVYNRYAHISVVLETEETMPEDNFELSWVDSYSVHLTPIDLKTLNVKRILSPRDLSDYSTSDIEIKTLGVYNNFYIHEVLY